MNSTRQPKILRLQKRSLIAAPLLCLLLGSNLAHAHRHDGYNHGDDAVADNPDWMSALSDDLLLSEMSIPATHDTMAYKDAGWNPVPLDDIWQCQTMSLREQLDSGIRCLDIRCVNARAPIDDSVPSAPYDQDFFAIHHGEVFLDNYFNNVLDTCRDFLRDNNNSETILVNVKEEEQWNSTYNDWDEPIGSFAQTFEAYKARYPAELFWEGHRDGNYNPTLAEMRGKIVFITQGGWRNGKSYGLHRHTGSSTPPPDTAIFPPNVEGRWQMKTNWDLYDKWRDTKAHLIAADNGDTNDIYMNLLNCAEGGFPYFFASGHSSPGTGAPRLATGRTSPGWSSWVDFPRVNCLNIKGDGIPPVCTIAFEGLNTLTTKYIRGDSPFEDRPPLSRAGIVRADFPGRGFIESIISLNPKAVRGDVGFAAGNTIIATGPQSTTDSPWITTTDSPYFVLAYENGSDSVIPATSFSNRLLLDGVEFATRYNWSEVTSTANNFELGWRFGTPGPLPAGIHELTTVLDVFNNVDETIVPGGESNNVETRHFAVLAPAGSDLTLLLPLAKFGVAEDWSDKLVLSTQEGTSTDAESITSADSVYADWAVANFGPATTTATFDVALKLDGTTIATGTAPIGIGNHPSGDNLQFDIWRVRDFRISPLSGGEHTLTLVIDTGSEIAEADENNNTYSRTFTVEPVLPVLGSADGISATGTLATPFEYQVEAQNTDIFSNFTATGLPAGLSIGTYSGIISGTPTEAGTFYPIISVSNRDGTESAPMLLTILAPPEITSPLLAAGRVTTFFEYQIEADYSPTVFNATGLPTGLDVDTSTGLISGTPTVAGTFNINLSATNAGGEGTAVLELTIVWPPVITSPANSIGVAGSQFSYQISASPTPTGYSTSALPAGLSIDPATGLIEGTPTSVGAFDIELVATNDNGSHTITLDLRILSEVPGEVSNTRDDGPGSLRHILDSGSPNYISFHDSLHGETITLTSGRLLIDRPLTIDASSAPDGVTISTAGKSRVIWVKTDSPVILKSLTIADGDSGGNGGGVLKTGAGPLSLLYCSLIGNTASRGGGLSVGDAARSHAIVTAKGCTFSDNHASNGGGGIRNFGTLTLEACTFSGNSATDDGGAIGSNGSRDLTVVRCTLAGNSAGDQGGAISTDTDSGNVVLVNSIVAGNSAQNLSKGMDLRLSPNAGSITFEGNNLFGHLDGIPPANQPAPSSTILDDPRLAPLADNGGPTKTMALLPGSPAIDAAGASSPSETDQRGFSRSRDGDNTTGARPDLGAYEAQATPLSVGLNFVGGGPADTTATLAPSDAAGAPGFEQTHWNNLTGDWAGSNNGNYLNGPSPATAVGTTPNALNLKLWWDAPNTWGKPAASLDSPDKKLMGGYLDSNASGDGTGNADLSDNSPPAAQPFVAVANLPQPELAGGYKVIVYTDTANASGRISRYWLTTNRDQDMSDVSGELILASPIFTRDVEDFSGTYTRAKAIADTGENTTPGNYLAFENLTTPSFILRAEEGSLPSSNQARAPINALQIVRNEIVVVTTTADELDPVGTLNTGVSLREALRDAPAGAGILFDRSLSGQTISLQSQLVIARDVTIDASLLPAGLTLDAGGTHRICTVTQGTKATLVALTLTGGNANGEPTPSRGGAVYGRSTSDVTLRRCTLSNNRAGEGGAVFSAGPLTVENSTLTANQGGYGGAIQCAYAPARITHSTIVANSAFNGGGIWNRITTLTLENSIVANNISDNGPDIFNRNATLNLVGTNLVPEIVTDPDSSVNGPDPIGTDPRLAPLGDFGGSAQTMPLLPDSPAIDASTLATGLTTDQRGLARKTGPAFDLGAAEFQATPDLERFWPLDLNGDGIPFGAEFAHGIDPLSAEGDTQLLPAMASDISGESGVTFGINPQAAPHTIWIVRHSTTLEPGSFVEIFRLNGATAATTIHPDYSISDSGGSIRIINHTSPPPATSFYQISTITIP